MNKIVLRVNLSGQFYFQKLIVVISLQRDFDSNIFSLAFLWKKEMTFAAIKIHFLQTET
jgi:hypothetical protein